MMLAAMTDSLPPQADAPAAGAKGLAFKQSSASFKNRFLDFKKLLVRSKTTIIAEIPAKLEDGFRMRSRSLSIAQSMSIAQSLALPHGGDKTLGDDNDPCASSLRRPARLVYRSSIYKPLRNSNSEHSNDTANSNAKDGDDDNKHNETDINDAINRNDENNTDKVNINESAAAAENDEEKDEESQRKRGSLLNKARIMLFFKEYSNSWQKLLGVIIPGHENVRVGIEPIHATDNKKMRRRMLMRRSILGFIGLGSENSADNATDDKNTKPDAAVPSQMFVFGSKNANSKKAKAAVARRSHAAVFGHVKRMRKVNQIMPVIADYFVVKEESSLSYPPTALSATVVTAGGSSKEDNETKLVTDTSAA
jgi:hypothetical protein